MKKGKGRLQSQAKNLWPFNIKSHNSTAVHSGGMLKVSHRQHPGTCDDYVQFSTRLLGQYEVVCGLVD